MNILRKRLEELDKGLYSAYMNSYDLAMKRWLPSINVSMGSYNSYPHLCNIEYYLNEILYTSKKISQNDIIDLNVAEIYVLLSSVLFHDIGKIHVDDENTRLPNSEQNSNHNTGDRSNFLTETDTKEGHAYKSKMIIKKHWAELGIISEEMADRIAEVCWFHDETDVKNFKLANDSLHTIFIDKYGEVRTRYIAVLLYLADHMDSTFSRTSHDFMEDKGFKGLFRKQIKGIHIDFLSKMICTSLDSNLLKNKDTDDVIKKILDIEMRVNADIPQQFNLLEAIIKNTWENSRAVEIIRDDLYSMGIPIHDWFIECDGHLIAVKKLKIPEDIKFINLVAVESIEPIFEKEFLDEIFAGMIFISSSILSPSMHSFYELMNYMRENDLRKIKCAAVRLSILSQNLSNIKNPIHCEPYKWRLNVYDTIELEDIAHNLRDKINRLYQEDDQKYEYSLR